MEREKENAHKEFQLQSIEYEKKLQDQLEEANQNVDELKREVANGKKESVGLQASYEKEINNLEAKLTEVLDKFNITNDRPIRIHHLMEDELVPLTVNQLLLGRNSTQKPCYNDEGELTTLCGAREFHHQLITAWWSMWKEQSFPYLLPFYSRSDTKKNANMKVGDVCQLKYADKISKYYRLCILVKTLLSKMV